MRPRIAARDLAMLRRYSLEHDLIRKPVPTFRDHALGGQMVVLGIETTCDETAAAVVERVDDKRPGRILSNVVLSQVNEHAAFGGVVPEIAARAHVEALDHVIAKAMADAGRTFDAIDGVAAAAGPGLIGGVIVGLTTAKAIALVTDKPLIAVNHLEAHALTARLTDGTPFPYCLFLASGGHTQIVAVRGIARLCAARHHHRRRHRRGLRQDREAAGPGLSGRTAGREGSGARQSAALRAAAADDRTAGAGFLALGLENRAAAGSGEDRAVERPGRRQSLRLVPAGGRRDDRGSHPHRPASVQCALRRADRAGRRRRGRRQSDDPQGAASDRVRGRKPSWSCRRRRCAPTTAR